MRSDDMMAEAEAELGVEPGELAGTFPPGYTNAPDDDDDLPEWEVSVTNTFSALDAEDAVRQMIEWLLDNAQHTGYRVSLSGNAAVEFIDGDDV